MTRPNPVKRVQWTDTFKADYKALPSEVKEAAKEALKDLVKEPIPKKRKFEKLEGHWNPSVFTIHATRNHSHKISFEIIEGVAVLRRVRTHKKIDRNP